MMIGFDCENLHLPWSQTPSDAFSRLLERTASFCGCESWWEKFMPLDGSLIGVEPTFVNRGSLLRDAYVEVSDVDHSMAFYCHVLGFELKRQEETRLAVVALGSGDHEIVLSTATGDRSRRARRRASMLCDVSIHFTNRVELAVILRRLWQVGMQPDGMSDHAVSEAVYCRDPDGNSIELYRDRTVNEWPRDPDGTLAIFSRPLDVMQLLADEAREIVI